jgi:hypothetical protein
MRRISDDRLVKITNLNLVAFPNGPRLPTWQSPQNPNLRPLWARAAFRTFEPLIAANRIAPHVSVRGSGHFAFTNVFQARRASAGTGDTLFVFHEFFLPWISLPDS